MTPSKKTRLRNLRGFPGCNRLGFSANRFRKMPYIVDYRWFLFFRYRLNEFNGQNSANSYWVLPVVSLVWVTFGDFHIYVTRMVVVPFSSHIWFSWSVVVFQFSFLKLVWVNLCHVVVLKRGDWSLVSKVSDGHHWSSYFGSMFTTLLFWHGICSIFSSHSGLSIWPHLTLDTWPCWREPDHGLIATWSNLMLSKVLPWSVCNNWWNSECCTTEMGMNNQTGKQALIKPLTCPENATATYPEEEYWK